MGSRGDHRALLDEQVTEDRRRALEPSRDAGQKGGRGSLSEPRELILEVCPALAGVVRIRVPKQSADDDRCDLRATSAARQLRELGLGADDRQVLGHCTPELA